MCCQPANLPTTSKPKTSPPYLALYPRNINTTHLLTINPACITPQKIRVIFSGFRGAKQASSFRKAQNLASVNPSNLTLLPLNPYDVREFESRLFALLFTYSFALLEQIMPHFSSFNKNFPQFSIGQNFS